jgi:hypothetical protein
MSHLYDEFELYSNQSITKFRVADLTKLDNDTGAPSP